MEEGAVAIPMDTLVPQVPAVPAQMAQGPATAQMAQAQALAQALALVTVVTMPLHLAMERRREVDEALVVAAR